MYAAVIMHPSTLSGSPMLPPFEFCLSPLHRPQADLHLCTVSLPPLAAVSTCQHVPSRTSSLLSFRDDSAQLLHRRTPGINRHPTRVLDRAMLGVVFKNLLLPFDQ